MVRWGLLRHGSGLMECHGDIVDVSGMGCCNEFVACALLGTRSGYLLVVGT
jgi:hypothetical protein